MRSNFNTISNSGRPKEGNFSNACLWISVVDYLNKYINDESIKKADALVDLIRDANRKKELEKVRKKGEMVSVTFLRKYYDPENKIFGKNVSTTMLRHIYLSSKYQNINELREVAKDMGSSLNMIANVYIKK